MCNGLVGVNNGSELEVVINARGSFLWVKQYANKINECQMSDTMSWSLINGSNRVILLLRGLPLIPENTAFSRLVTRYLSFSLPPLPFQISILVMVPNQN